MVKRLQRANEYEPLGHDGWEAADLIIRQAASLREAIKEVSNIGRQLGEEQGLHDSTKASLREAVEYLQGASASIHDAMKDTSWSDGEDYVKQIDAWLAKQGGDSGRD